MSANFESEPQSLTTTHQVEPCFSPSSPFEQDIKSKICVKAPYNRLYDLVEHGETGIKAKVKLESPQGLEFGGPSSAEIGRHMAILGSCVLARNTKQDGSFYYLAKSAKIVRENKDKHFEPWSTCQLVATLKDKQSVDVTTTCADTGLVMARLTCSYQRLSPRLFDRLFAAHRMETPETQENPYAKEVAWLDLKLEGSSGRARIEKVCPPMCVGHFKDYPALPVAILMDRINRLACEHLHHASGEVGIVSEGQIDAESLAFAGEELEFSVQQTKTLEKEVYYEGFVRNLAGKTFARTHFCYSKRKEQ